MPPPEWRAAPPRMTLRAGPLTMLFEPETAFLRRIRLGDTEVVRGVYGAVRDRDWGTVPVRVSLDALRRRNDSFRIDYRVAARSGAIDFEWRGTLTGGSDGTVEMRFDGRARSTFLRNRIGLCVLHPIRECAGRPCTVEHVDGSVQVGRFPGEISPHQPFRSIRAITHEVSPGVAVEVRLEGEIFEMEDQRNWTDASFKTYGTPLELPFPVPIEAGAEVRQSVKLSLRGLTDPGGSRLPARRSEVGLRVEDSGPALPAVGLALPRTGAIELGNPAALEALRALRPHHVRVDLWLDHVDLPTRLEQAVSFSRASGAPLEIALHLTDAAEDELRAFRTRLRRTRPTIARWLVFHQRGKCTPPVWVDLTRTLLEAYDRRVPFGAGTDAFFAELNRERPTPGDGLDFVCYSIHPQVHAFDDLSLVETLPVQGETVENARRFGAGPVAVTPVTLGPRFNPDATAGEGASEAPSRGDARQGTLFGAAWTLGSLKHLAEAGAQSLTFYEGYGDRGVISSPAPGADRQDDERVFPAYHVLADVCELAGSRVQRVISSDPLEADALAIRHSDGTSLLVANLSAAVRVVRIAVPGTWRLSGLRVLDETTLDLAISDRCRFRRTGAELPRPEGGELRLRLRPHAYVRVELLG